MLIIIFISFAACFIIERLNLGWKLPEVPTWTIRVLGVNFIQLGVVLLAGISWEKWFSSFSLFTFLSTYRPLSADYWPILLPHLFFTGGTGGVTKSTFYGRISTKSTIVPSVLR